MKYFLILIVLSFLSLQFAYSEWEKVETDFEYIRHIANQDEYIYYSSTIDGIHRYNELTGENTNINDGLPSTVIYSLSVCGQRIYVGVSNLLFYSENYGDNWVKVERDFYTDISVIYCDDNSIYLLTLDSLYISDDDGISWLSNERVKTSVPSIAIHNNDIYIGGAYKNGLFMTSDRGNTWVEIESDAKYWVPPIIYSLYSTEDFIIIGTPYFHTIRSTNNGKDWQASEEPTIGQYIHSFTHKDNYLFAAGASLQMNPSIQGMFVSTNQGINWTAVGLNDYHCHLTLIKDNWIYTGTNQGLFRAKIDHIVSVEDNITQQHTLSLHPNPAGDILHIENGSPNSAIEIYSVLGIVQMKLPYSTSIDVSRLPAGVYFLRSGVEYTVFVKD